jgi:hypothetical protein
VSCANNYVRAPQAHPGGERCGTRGGPVAVGGLDLAALHPDSHLDRLEVARTHRMALVTAWLTVRTRSSTTSPGMAVGSCRKLVGQEAFQLSPAAGVTAVMAWRRVLQARVEPLCHRTNVGAVWRQPSRSPWQRPPAVIVTAAVFSGGAALHRPLGLPQPVQLRRQRPGAMLQILQVGVAVTAGRGHGRPDSASRRSGGCTDGRRRAWASTCSGGPYRSPSRARCRSPRTGASSGASRGLTALGLAAMLQPTEPAGTAQPSASVTHRTPRRSDHAGHGLIRSVP